MAGVEHWGVPLAVLGLVVTLVLLASLHRRYQVHQATVRAAVRRIEPGLRAIEDALETLRKIPLSRELRVTLRAEVLARYRRIARLCSAYPGIRQRTAEAETALHAEGQQVSSGVGPIPDHQAFHRLNEAIEALLAVLRSDGTMQPLPQDVRAIFQRELGERRAEVLSRFYFVEARRHAAAGKLRRARSHLTMLMQRLRAQCPPTAFVKALSGEAEQMLLDLQRTPDEQTSVETAGLVASGGRANAVVR